MTKKMTQQPSRIVGVLLLYYQDYADEAVSRFVAVLNAVCRENVCIVVKNQALNVRTPAHPNLHVIDGDNALREFSGWGKGIEYCRSHQLLSRDGILVLANDTFCHHNKFGPITETAFVLNFKKLMRGSDALTISGEIQTAPVTFSIAGKPFSRWISTYLFAITAPLLDRLDHLTPPFDLDIFFSQSAESDPFLTGPLDGELNKHICSWLFGQNTHTNWYGSSPRSPSNHQQFVDKAKSILCEMYLSAAVADLGGHFESVFKSPMLVQARRLERLLLRYRRR